MSTALAKTPHAQIEFTPEQVGILRTVVCPEFNEHQLKVFMIVCARTGLDPFSKQIYGFINKGRPVNMVSISGLRAIAQRSGEYLGQEGPFWCGRDGTWHDVWISETPPVACKVLVHRKHFKAPTPGVALWREYGAKQHQKSAWGSHPTHMLYKCAMANALRGAFPVLGDLYVAEEFADTDSDEAIDAEFTEVPTPAPEAPPPPQSQPPGAEMSYDQERQWLDDFKRCNSSALRALGAKLGKMHLPDGAQRDRLRKAFGEAVARTKAEDAERAQEEA